MQTIRSLCEKIRAIYKPGVEFNIVHEGHFYIGKTPLVSSEADLNGYLYSFRKLIENDQCIKSYSIYELIPLQLALSDLLDEFSRKYIPSDEELGKLIIQETTFLELYKAYKKINMIYFKDDPAFSKLSKAKRMDHVKALALAQMRVYFGFGRLVKDFFKEKVSLRLSSLYKAPSFVEYVAINYLPDKHHFSTPAFNCLVEYKDGHYDFIRKHVALEKNYSIVEHNGLKYFKEVL